MSEAVERVTDAEPTPAIGFEIVGADFEQHAAAPTMVFACRVTEATGLPVYTIALNYQINIEPARRRYDDQTRKKLAELFGEPQRWGATTHSFMWSKQSALVPSFSNETTFEIIVPCTYDLEVVAAKYFYSLPDGHIPLAFLMSGSVFFRQQSGSLRIVQVPWDNQARFSLPVETWKQMIRHHYPNGSWIRLNHDTVEALRHYKAEHGLPSFDDAVTELLPEEGRG